MKNLVKFIGFTAMAAVLAGMLISITACGGGGGGGNQTVDELLNDGLTALEDKNYDAAIKAFEDAYNKDKNNQTAIVYSTLGRLASIAVDTNVKELMKNRLGIKNYPGTIDALISPDWMETYYSEKRWWYYDGDVWLSWYDEDDSWFFSGSDLTPKSGYYMYQYQLILGETTKRQGKLDYYYDESDHYVSWYDENSWIFSNYGITPQAGYYYGSYVNNSWTYTFVSSTPKIGDLDDYYDSGHSYYWRDSVSAAYTGFTVPGYYYTQNSTYVWVTDTPHYDEYNYPGMDAPAWFTNTNTYKENSLTSAKAQNYLIYPYLVYSTLLDKNPQGLNNLLDDLLSVVFGANFEAAYSRGATLTGDVKLSEETLELFGLKGIFEDDVYIGKAELNGLLAALRFVKASLEWVAAYDWNTDLSFFKNGPIWDDDWSKATGKPANLPLRNNFLKDRNNGNMAKSKADFIKAIDDTVAAYEIWIGDTSKLPEVYKDGLSDHQWIKDGFTKFKASINGSTVFYAKTYDAGVSAYANTAANAVFGIDLGKFFTPGQFSLSNLIETTGDGSSPVFYGYTYDGNWWWKQNETWTKINAKAEIKNYKSICFKVKTSAIKQVFVLGLDDTYNSDAMANKLGWWQFDYYPVYAEHIWGWYNQ